MESVTTTNISQDVTELPDTLASVRTSTKTTVLQNFNTTSAQVPLSPELEEDQLFMWMPLIFVVMFAVIVMSLIILSRISIRSPCCNSWGLQRASHGDTSSLFLVFFHFVVRPS